MSASERSKSDRPVCTGQRLVLVSPIHECAGSHPFPARISAKEVARERMGWTRLPGALESGRGMASRHDALAALPVTLLFSPSAERDDRKISALVSTACQLLVRGFSAGKFLS